MAVSPSHRRSALRPHPRAQVYTLSPIAGFAIYIKVSLITAMIIALPWAIYQLWRFFEVGLYPRERRAVLLVAPFSAVMSALGVAFMYCIMLPVCLWFLISFSTSFPVMDGHTASSPLLHTSPATQPAQPVTSMATAGDVATAIQSRSNDPVSPFEGQVWFNTAQQDLKTHVGGKTRTVRLNTGSLINPLIEIGQYINFVIVLTIGIVVAFQLPVIMLIVGWWGLVDPRLLAQYRKHCVLTCFAIGALLTPADILSMLLLSFPLWGLFEFGLLLMRSAYRKQNETKPTS